MTYKKIYMTFNIKRHMHARVIFSRGKKSSLTMMNRNRKKWTKKRTGEKRVHIVGRAYAQKTMGAAGGGRDGGLAKQGQLTPTVADVNRHKVTKKGRMAVLTKAKEENPSVFAHPVDAFVMVIIKQLGVKHWMALIETMKLEERIAQTQDALNWAVVLDLENVQVTRLAKMYTVPKRDIWPPMQSARDVATWGKGGGGVPLEVWMAGSTHAVSACVYT